MLTRDLVIREVNEAYLQVTARSARSASGNRCSTPSPGRRARRAGRRARGPTAPPPGLTSLAEGVETSDQLETLTRLGCTCAQGHHVAMPAPADAVTATLGGRARGRPRAG